MSNLFSSLSECFGFSHMILSAFCKTFFALKPMSSRFPIGVDIIYKPLLSLFILFILTIIISCTPQNFPEKNNVPVSNTTGDSDITANHNNRADTIYEDIIPQYIESINSDEIKNIK